MSYTTPNSLTLNNDVRVAAPSPAAVSVSPSFNDVSAGTISITSNVLTCATNNVFSVGESATFHGMSAATFLEGISVTVASVTRLSATITNIAITGSAAPALNGTLTVNCVNTFVVGQVIELDGLTTATQLNGTQVTIATVSGTQFTASVKGYLNYTSAADTGTAKTMYNTQFTASFTHANYGPTADTGKVGTVVHPAIYMYDSFNQNWADYAYIDTTFNSPGEPATGRLTFDRPIWYNDSGSGFSGVRQAVVSINHQSGKNRGHAINQVGYFDVALGILNAGPTNDTGIYGNVYCIYGETHVNGTATLWPGQSHGSANGDSGGGEDAAGGARYNTVDARTAVDGSTPICGQSGQASCTISNAATGSQSGVFYIGMKGTASNTCTGAAISGASIIGIYGNAWGSGTADGANSIGGFFHAGEAGGFNVGVAAIASNGSGSTNAAVVADDTTASASFVGHGLVATGFGNTSFTLHDGWYGFTGTPQSTLTAKVGSMYSQQDGAVGTSLWVKESGSGNTGWAPLRNVQQNAQTGTTYAILDGDRSKLITFTNTAAIAVTIAQAGAASSFLTGWYCYVENMGTGIVTITPATSTINGWPNLRLGIFQSALISSDGTNYEARVTGIASTDPASALTSYLLTDAGTGAASNQIVMRNMGASNLNNKRKGLNIYLESNGQASGSNYDAFQINLGATLDADTSATVGDFDGVELYTAVNNAALTATALPRMIGYKHRYNIGTSAHVKNLTCFGSAFTNTNGGTIDNLIALDFATGVGAGTTSWATGVRLTMGGTKSYGVASAANTAQFIAEDATGDGGVGGGAQGSFIGHGTGISNATNLADYTLHDGWYGGTGSPETVITANIGSMFSQQDGANGAAFWIKRTGSSNIGWEHAGPFGRKDLTAQAAAIGTATLYAVPASGARMYRVSYYLVISQAADTSSAVQLTIGWTDDTTTTQTKTSTNIVSNVVGTADSGSFQMYAKASTNITYATSYSSTAGITPANYILHLSVEEI